MLNSVLRDSRQALPLGLIWTMLLVIAALTAAPASLRAQVHRIDNPVDSFLWWTLSDEITPAELKRLYSDPALSLTRLAEAVDAGLETPLSEERLGRLTFYINHQLTPELAPMWWAFDIFARDYVAISGSASVVPGLTSYQISQAGIERILVSAHACAADREVLMADLGPKQAEAQGLIRDRLLEERAGKAQGRPIMESVNDRDYEVVASVTGRQVEEVRDLVDALADWEAGRRLVAACLPTLKFHLEDEDWQLFRAYLREQIIAPLGGTMFLEPGVEEKAP